MIDSVAEYQIAKAIVGSVSEAEWNSLRLKSGEWSGNHEWKIFRNCTIDKLMYYMDSFKEKGGNISAFPSTKLTLT